MRPKLGVANSRHPCPPGFYLLFVLLDDLGIPFGKHRHRFVAVGPAATDDIQTIHQLHAYTSKHMLNHTTLNLGEYSLQPILCALFLLRGGLQIRSIHQCCANDDQYPTNNFAAVKMRDLDRGPAPCKAEVTGYRVDNCKQESKFELLLLMIRC